jgi:L-ascorbate metabolism protein UlaG (beta-lactamase superfamily)
MSDIGHDLDAATLKKIARSCDAYPVAVFHSDADEASKIMDAISPPITIPMHYKTEKCTFQLVPLDLL